MKLLTLSDFALDLKQLTNSIDFDSLRSLTELPDYTSLSNNYNNSLKLILVFNNKWQLAFKRFNLYETHIDANTKNLTQNALFEFTQKLEKSEKTYYEKKFDNAPAIAAHKLNSSYDWPKRFFIILKFNQPWKDSALSKLIRSFIELLTLVSKSVQFMPHQGLSNPGNPDRRLLL